MSKANLEVETIDKSLVVRALEGLGVGLVLTNAQGRVTWLNRAAQRVIGLDVETSRGRTLQSLLQDPKLAEFWRGASGSDELAMADVQVAVPRAARLKANAASTHDAHGQLLGRALVFLEMPAASAERPAERPLPTGTPEGLTPQEMKVLRLVGDGLSNRQIAEKMQVAPSTVRSHLKHLYSKLGLRSRSEAVSYALRSAGSLPQ